MKNILKDSFATEALFDWYDTHARLLPWRRRWPELAPAYHVWLSEIMLQQTVVATVIPYFLDFTRRWPTVQALAAAPLEDVLAAWAGLGYYARARNLHKTACIVSSEMNGVFPIDYRALIELPGIGPYTAGAISVIAYGQRDVVVDGNIERVMARHFAIETPLPEAKKEIVQAYGSVIPDERPSDFPQALMDFANLVCTVKAPKCTSCPLASGCDGYHRDMALSLPVKAAKKEKETRRGIAFVAQDADGKVLHVTRKEQGMLGGMLAFPSQGWAVRGEAYDREKAPMAAAPFGGDWRLLDASVKHVFTHFALEMDVAVIEVSKRPIIDGQWQAVRMESLPSLMRKVWKLASASL